MGACFSEPLKVITIDDARSQLYEEMRKELAKDLKDDLIPYILNLANEMHEITTDIIEPIAETALEKVIETAINKI